MLKVTLHARYCRIATRETKKQVHRDDSRSSLGEPVQEVFRSIRADPLCTESLIGNTAAVVSCNGFYKM